MTNEPKQVSGTDIYLYDQAIWDRRTVADGRYLQQSTLEPISANDRILASAITDTSGILQEEIIYLGDNIGNLSGDLYITSSYLNEEIDKINARSDVTDVVGSYTAFEQLSAEVIAGTYEISDGDIIKILNDETRDHGQTYYRYSANAPETSAWTYVGYLEPHFYGTTWTTPLNNHNTLEVKNTSNERSFKLGASNYIELIKTTGNEYDFKLNDGFVNSASKVYETFSSISAINDGTLTGPKVNHKVSDYSLAQGSGNSAMSYSFAQGLSSLADSNSIAVGKYNIASGISQALGLSNSAKIISFAAGQSAFADDNSFAQGSANYANVGSFAQGITVIANDKSFAQGLSAFANVDSFAQGIKVTARNISFAQGSTNYANTDSFAQGQDVSADTYSFAQGYRCSAYDDSIAQGYRCSAYKDSIAQGEYNSAVNVAQALGKGLIIDGGMAIGKYNKTTDARFVIGNGTSNSNRSDLYWINNHGDVYTDGTISAENFYINGNPIDSLVSAKFSAYDGTTKVGEFPISSFSLKANTAKYISATTAANTMIFNVSDALIDSAASGYQASAWISANSARITNIENSAKSGAAASAYITANSGNFLNTAHSAYGTLTFNTKAYNANTSSYGLTISAGQGISFITGSDKVTISAEGTTYSNGTYISTANKTISVTGSLITSANAGSAASAWVDNTLFDYYWRSGPDAHTASGKIDQIKVCYKNDIDTPSYITNQEIIFKNGNDVISGLLIQAASPQETGNVLTYNSLTNSYTWENVAFSNLDHNIVIDNNNKTINLPSSGLSINSAYSATYDNHDDIYYSELNGQSLKFSHGTQSLYISLTGIASVGPTTTVTANFDNLLGNFVNASAGQTITVATATTLPPRGAMENGVFYIV